jgi:hypothetical protein
MCFLSTWPIIPVILAVKSIIFYIHGARIWRLLDWELLRTTGGWLQPAATSVNASRLPL